MGHSGRRWAALVGASALSVMRSLAADAAEPPPAAPDPTDRASLEKLIMERMGKSQGGAPRAVQDGIEVVLQTGHSAEIAKVAVSPDGKYVLSGSFDETAKLWDVASGQEVRTLHGFAFGGPILLGFSADSSRFLIHDGRSLTLYDAATGVEIRRLSQVDYSLAPTVSADGRLGVAADAASPKRSLSIVDLTTGKVVWALPTDAAESAVALSADGSVLLTRRLVTSRQGLLARFGGSIDEHAELRVWDVAKRSAARSLAIGLGSQIDTVALSPDGATLLDELPDRTIAVYNLKSGQRIRTLSGHWTARSRATTALTFSPNGRLVARGTFDGVQLWDIATGGSVATLDASAVSFSADGSTLVLGKPTGGAPLLRDLTTGRETALGGGATGVFDLALAGDGRMVAAATDDGIRLWDLSTGQIVRDFECPGRGGATSVSMSTRSSWLATGCADGSAWLWDLDTGRRLNELSPATASGEWIPVQARFSADGQLLAVGLKEQLTLWDVAAGRQISSVTLPRAAPPPGLAALFGQMGLPALKNPRTPDAGANNPTAAAASERSHWIQAVAVHPQGQLVAVSNARQVTLWDMSVGKLIRQFGGQSAVASAQPGAPPGANAETSSAKGASGKPRSRGVLGAFFGASPMSAGRGDQPPAQVAPDMAEMMRALQVAQSGEGARSLVFSSDGKTLLTLGNTGKHVWDVASGEEVRVAPQTGVNPADPNSLLDAILPAGIGPGAGAPLAHSPDGHFAAYGVGHVIRLWELGTGRDTAELVGHASDVTSLVFVPNRPLLISGSRDGSVRVWDLQTNRESAALIALGQTDSVAVTPDGYYRASKSSLKGVAFRVKGQLYPFEQFDLRFNRPDVVLERLGLAPRDTVQTYRNAYERRLRKTGFNPSMLGAEFHAPEVEVASDIPTTTSESTLAFRVKASDDKYPLDRINVFVNDVPIYGAAGLPVADRTARSTERELRIPLVPGRNKVQVAVINQQGAESLKRTLYTNATGSFPAADVYVVAIGVSEYKNSAYNLRFAAKDADDFTAVYKALETRPGAQGHVHTLMLTDSRATRTQIQQAKEWLRQAQPHDLVVVFAAGHGMTDAESNYYFGTYDVDAAQPAANGLPYEEFEGLLDGIPALQKVLLLDTCFSGEIDKDVGVAVAGADTGGAGTVTMRAFKPIRGVTVTADSGATNVPGPRLSSAMLRFQQDWFADLRRGTGAAVISSSSGDEFSLEGEQWHNGVFTYALLQGLKNSEADANKDHVVTVSELQAYVIDQVRKLTAGGQNPTVRRENLDYDFPVYY